MGLFRRRRPVVVAGTPVDARGQVSHFGYDEPTNLFDLTTIDRHLLFAADRLAVTMEPRRRDRGQSAGARSR